MEDVQRAKFTWQHPRISVEVETSAAIARDLMNSLGAYFEAISNFMDRKLQVNRDVVIERVLRDHSNTFIFLRVGRIQVKVWSPRPGSSLLVCARHACVESLFSLHSKSRDVLDHHQSWLMDRRKTVSMT
jgi:hypothetical protein